MIIFLQNYVFIYCNIFLCSPAIHKNVEDSQIHQRKDKNTFGNTQGGASTRTSIIPAASSTMATVTLGRKKRKVVKQTILLTDDDDSDFVSNKIEYRITKLKKQNKKRTASPHTKKMTPPSKNEKNSENEAKWEKILEESLGKRKKCPRVPSIVSKLKPVVISRLCNRTKVFSPGDLVTKQQTVTSTGSKPQQMMRNNLCEATEVLSPGDLKEISWSLKQKLSEFGEIKDTTKQQSDKQDEGKDKSSPNENKKEAKITSSQEEKNWITQQQFSSWEEDCEEES